MARDNAVTAPPRIKPKSTRQYAKIPVFLPAENLDMRLLSRRGLDRTGGDRPPMTGQRNIGYQTGGQVLLPVGQHGFRRANFTPGIDPITGQRFPMGYQKGGAVRRR
jgi:hypothetical protein